MSLGFHNVNHSYGATAVLHDISLTANSGDILCLLGPSGSGKSTLLRLAAGLESIQHGKITLSGQLLADTTHQPPPEHRPIGLVFQDHVLFPHLDVAGNVGFGLRALSKTQRAEKVEQQLASVGLSNYGDRFPHTLSGGQQQRVALARALATEPAIMLLDEPFAAVDSTLRRALRNAARDALKAAGTTTIVVTHDPDEAMELADRIAVMVDGRIQQSGTPAEIWQTPTDRTVAMLFGEPQCLQGRVRNGFAECDFGYIPHEGRDDEPVDIVIRPNAVRLVRADSAAASLSTSQANSAQKHAPPQARARVSEVRFIGGQTQLTLVNDARPELVLLARIENPKSIQADTLVQIELDPAGTFAFSTA